MTSFASPSSFVGCVSRRARRGCIGCSWKRHKDVPHSHLSSQLISIFNINLLQSHPSSAQQYNNTAIQQHNNKTTQQHNHSPIKKHLQDISQHGRHESIRRPPPILPAHGCCTASRSGSIQHDRPCVCRKEQERRRRRRGLERLHIGQFSQCRLLPGPEPRPQHHHRRQHLRGQSGNRLDEVAPEVQDSLRRLPFQVLQPRTQQGQLLPGASRESLHQILAPTWRVRPPNLPHLAISCRLIRFSVSLITFVCVTGGKSARECERNAAQTATGTL